MRGPFDKAVIFRRDPNGALMVCVVVECKEPVTTEALLDWYSATYGFERDRLSVAVCGEITYPFAEDNP